MRKVFRSGRAGSVAVSALSLSLLLALPLVASAASDNTNAAVPAAMRQALQRDLGLGPGQLPRYLEAERRAIHQHGQAARTLGDRFAGAWLERDATGEFKLVIATTDRTQAAKARALGDEVRVVRHSLAKLDAVMAQLNKTHKAQNAKLARKTDPRLHSWHVDLETNSVVITTDPGAQDAAIELVAASGADENAVRMVTAKQRPQPVYDIRGGDRYNVPNSWCSMGFSVLQGNTSGFVTAGHCGGAGTAVSGANGVALGSFAASRFPGADYAWVRNTNPGNWNILSSVNNYAGGNVDVRGGMEAAVGAAVCRSGARTGYRCGTITAKNVTVNYSAGPVYGMVQSNACVGGGDSGGSFITPGAEAQGVTSGGVLNGSTNENCSLSQPVTYHQPLQPILNAYNLVLRTVPSCGRLNPGDWRGTDGTVVSCDGRFTFVIQGDGNLVLYKNGVGPLWANHVYGGGHTLHMQTDGNLVVYNSAGQARWSTNTWGKNGAALFVQNDGNVVVYDHLGKPLWHTNTWGH